MHAVPHTLRNDDRYSVVVGWNEELETFYAYVHEPGGLAEPLLVAGRERREIPAISQLAAVVARFAPLDADMVSTLRREARPLTGDLRPVGLE